MSDRADTNEFINTCTECGEECDHDNHECEEDWPLHPLPVPSAREAK